MRFGNSEIRVVKGRTVKVRKVPQLRGPDNWQVLVLGFNDWIPFFFELGESGDGPAIDDRPQFQALFSQAAQLLVEPPEEKEVP